MWGSPEREFWRCLEYVSHEGRNQAVLRQIEMILDLT